MSIDSFKEKVAAICAADTSAHPEEWTIRNPYLGHCTIVSLLAQDLFGGEVLRVDLRKVPGFEHIQWHSWNRLPDGREIDFTESQFDIPLPKDLEIYIPSRETLFGYGAIQKRYELLRERFLALPSVSLKRPKSHQ